MPDVGFDNTDGAVSDVRAAGGVAEVTMTVSETILGGESLDIRWSYTIDGVAADDPVTTEDEAEPIPFAFICFDGGGTSRILRSAACANPEWADCSPPLPL